MSENITKRWDWKIGGDRALWVIVIILAAVSLLVVYSSTAASVYSSSGADGSHTKIFLKQLIVVLVSLAGVYVVHKINYQLYGRIVWVAYALSLAFTILVFFIGTTGTGAEDAPRWIMIPLLNFTFQPSDFLKVTTVMAVARELARRQNDINRGSIFPPLTPRGWRENPNSWRILKETTIPLLFPIILSCVIVFPTNLSTALILFATCFVMLFIGRVRVSDLGKWLLIVIVVAGLGIGFLYAIGKPPARMETWVNRALSYVGIGDKAEDADYNYQIEQAKIAIASGGVWGRGPGQSVQRNNLPKAESDYAYAFIIEEYGVVGGVFILLLYLWIFYQATLIFRKCGTA
ncbi:MAG: FtsW/RodA/SpoVE family cell cycle protein, partial [Rikenellaceae bacterium]|nr:FtsW/RodA/SpoVE family cell cycle protein [Rikenellaceae bacterium]